MKTTNPRSFLPRGLIAMLGLAAVFACGGASDDSNLGVAPWSGPPTDFNSGVWDAQATDRQSGKSIAIEFLTVGQPNIALNDPRERQFPGALYMTPAPGEEDTLCYLNGSVDARRTDDLHGFDADVTTPLTVATLHVRADAQGELHGEMRIDHQPIVRRNGHLETCDADWTFVARRTR